MSEVFDIERERALLCGPIGFEHYIGWSFEEAVGNHALSRSGQMLVGLAVNCIAVGFDNEALGLLQKAKKWLEHAIATEEKPNHYFKYGTEASRHENLALCNWLLNNRHDQENLDAAVSFGALYNAENAPTKDSAAIELPVYIDAGHFDDALTFSTRLWGAKKPSRLRGIKSEAAACYVLAAARIHDEYSDEQVRAAIEGFLRHQVPDFLKRGAYPYLARWLKIAHWNDNEHRLKAYETVRRCYDYLPDVVRPSFG